MLEATRRKSIEKGGSCSNHKIAITYRRIDDLKLNPRNPRLHSKKQIRQIAQSISSFQFNVPVLVDSELQVIGGHGRILAAKELGLSEIPTICLEHLTDLQARAFMIADNQLTVNSEWDDRLLGEQLKLLSEAELNFDIEATGFDLGEIDMRIEGLAIDHDEDCDEPNPQTDARKVTQPSDLWVLGPHRIYCGDALDSSSYMTLMEDKKATMVFIDPPYNVPIEGHASGLGNRKSHPVILN